MLISMSQSIYIFIYMFTSEGAYLELEPADGFLPNLHLIFCSLWFE